MTYFRISKDGCIDTDIPDTAWIRASEYYITEEGKYTTPNQKERFKLHAVIAECVPFCETLDKLISKLKKEKDITISESGLRQKLVAASKQAMIY